MVNLFMETVHAWNRWCYFTLCWVAEDNVWFKPTRVTHRDSQRKQNSGPLRAQWAFKKWQDWGELSNEFVLCATWDEDEAKFIYTRVCKLNDLHGFNHGK